ncbi:MAG: glycoside hydrolase family 3 C-terminal domain-containing protein [Anaerolineales bacterium]|nr:glycoside hydrolase family 3 C-terminal domain-containing protein [Anaerolineales bacterium]
MSRINDLINQMTLDEKISMLAGADLWHSVSVSRLGIPQFKMTDGPNGARGAKGSMSTPSVATPVGIALGATWNPRLIEKVGNVLADELKAKGAHILLAPTVNIHRTPIAGRNFECYSEDPFLSGMIASAYIKGIQDNGVGACIKHFIANDQEYERFSISSEVDERTLREIYLEPFRIAIRNSNPWAVMSSYNRVNGVYACEYDHSLLEILKGEWNYDGIVMSDWFGTYDDGVPAGGLDLEMPGPARWMSAEVVKKSLESGTLTEERLNDKVRRLLGVLEKAGLFENPVLQPEKGEDKPEHRAIIREAAQEAIVLLKNNGILPLANVKTIAMIGPYARTAQILGGGSSSVTPHYTVSPFDGVNAPEGKDVLVEAATGAFIYKNLPAPAPETLSTPNGESGLRLSLFAGTEFEGEPLYVETSTRVQHGWFDNSVPNVPQDNFSLRMEGLFTPQESGLHTLALSAVGWCRLYLDEKLVVDHGSDSDMGKQKTAEIELEGGKAYNIKVEYYWKGDPRWRAVAFGHQPPHSADMIAEAVELAKRSDVAVIVAGLNGDWESEGFDRVDMKLPGQQDELIRQVVAANPNTIVVLNVGSPVEMPWADDVPAILQLWYNSQEQGNALADVLFGDANPSGKLPTTFPVRLEDNPAYINYPGENGKVRYGEGIFVGYRYYDKKKVEPLFPFGHGLSYTTFEYSNLQINKKSITPNETMEVKVDVTNTGKVTGKEVVQLYVRDIKSTFARPEKELKAFEKVELAPQQTKTITFTLDREAFWYFETTLNAWSVEAGEFEILVGASSRDIRASQMVTIEPVKRAARLHAGLLINTILDDPDGRAVISKHIGGFLLMADMRMAGELTLEQVAHNHPTYVPQELVKKIEEELAKIK